MLLVIFPEQGVRVSARSAGKEGKGTAGGCRDGNGDGDIELRQSCRCSGKRVGREWEEGGKRVGRGWELGDNPVRYLGTKSV